MTKPCEYPAEWPKLCGKPSVTTVPAHRWGKKGEPSVVHYQMPLCAACAEKEAERMDEGAAEAAGS